MASAIFWDFDGTLVHKNQSFLESLKKALQEQDCKIEEGSCISFLKSACSWNHPQESYVDLTGEKWWKNLLEKTEQFLSQNLISIDKQKVICEKFRENAIKYPYSIYEDAYDILKYTKEKGYQNYLLSNNFPELIDTIEKFELGSFFTDYFLSANIGYEKPRLEIFQYAINKAGNPQDAYMIGDNPVADIKGAYAAGMHTIFVHAENEFKEAEYVCKTLSEIKTIL